MEEPNLFITVSGLGIRLDLTRSRVDQLVSHPGFPDPLPGVPWPRIYLRAQVEQWIATNRAWQSLPEAQRDQACQDLHDWVSSVCDPRPSGAS